MTAVIRDRGCAPPRRWLARLRLAVAVAAVWTLAGFPAAALGARVLVLGAHGHVAVRNDRFLALPAVTPTAAGSAAARRGGQTVFLTSASFGYGINGFSVPALAHTGSYTVRLGATDLAGNYNRIVDGLQVSR